MKIIKGLLALIAVAAVAGGATYAYFFSTATMSGSTFTVGTMNLQIDQNVSGGTDDWVSGFDITSDAFKNANGWNTAAWNVFMDQSGLRNLYPGATKEQIMDIKNSGPIDGFATIKFDAVDWSSSVIADNLNFTVYYDPTDGSNFTTPIASGTLAAWNHNTYQLGALAKNQIGQVKIVWSVPTSAGNDIQGAWVTVNTTFGLNQVVDQQN